MLPIVNYRIEKKKTQKNGKKSLSTWVIIETKNLVFSNKKKRAMSPFKVPQIIAIKCNTRPMYINSSK